MRESPNPSSPLSEPLISPTPLVPAPAGHGSLGPAGYRYVASWEGLKGLYRAAIVTSVQAYHEYYTLLTAPDPHRPDVAADPVAFAAYRCPPISPTTARELARRYALYEAMQPIVSMARLCGRIAWGDADEEALYGRLSDETIHAARQAAQPGA